MSVTTKLTGILATAFLRLMSCARTVETKFPFAQNPSACIQVRDLLTLGRSVILAITIGAETPHLCPWFDRQDLSLMATGLVDGGMEVYGMVFHGLAGFCLKGRVLGLHGKLRVTVAPFP